MLLRHLLSPCYLGISAWLPEVADSPRAHSRQADYLPTGACGRIFGQELKKPQSHRLSACKTRCLLFWPLGLEMSDTGRLFQASWLHSAVQKTAMTHRVCLEPPFFGCLCSFGIPKATCFSDLRTLPRVTERASSGSDRQAAGARAESHIPWGLSGI